MNTLARWAGRFLVGACIVWLTGPFVVTAEGMFMTAGAFAILAVVAALANDTKPDWSKR